MRCDYSFTEYKYKIPVGHEMLILKALDCACVGRYNLSVTVDSMFSPFMITTGETVTVS